jgi:hypothetical protein
MDLVPGELPSGVTTAATDRGGRSKHRPGREAARIDLIVHDGGGMPRPVEPRHPARRQVD